MLVVGQSTIQYRIGGPRVQSPPIPDPRFLMGYFAILSILDPSRAPDGVIVEYESSPNLVPT